jgi:hypothetical protein
MAKIHELSDAARGLYRQLATTAARWRQRFCGSVLGFCYHRPSQQRREPLDSVPQRTYCTVKQNYLVAATLTLVRSHSLFHVSCFIIRLICPIIQQFVLVLQR